MTVNTKRVEGRRQLRYENYDALLADAEQLATGGSRAIGNWSLGQILTHLATAFEMSLDGATFRIPWPIRFVARTFMKKKFVHGRLDPGFQVPNGGPAGLSPDQSTTTEAGLEAMRKVIARLKSEPHRAIHPVLGKLTREETDQFNLRHAEMHMSFAVPA